MLMDMYVMVWATFVGRNCVIIMRLEVFVLMDMYSLCHSCDAVGDVCR